MSVYAVEYVYSPQTAAIRDEHRPAHRAWLASLVEDGRMLASGPFDDGTGALLIFKTEDEEALNRLLTEDPFNIAGGITGLKSSSWSPVLGELSKHVQ
ncbi:hypothetical protein IV500_07630 [Paeniglutamicibacter antarcticus]|uniref:YCII-related domain-containing protein n=1 Tax=Arthrobacter terrae TaxID=2935737 RepID=A0A931G7G1_9MICC|nr:YciI family protein [Arthrobacter terrae]MBG0739259.1 hypothetical protein [Arthrobacter terrae]